MGGACSSRVRNKKLYSENLWKTRIGRLNLRVDLGAVNPVTEIRSEVQNRIHMLTLPDHRNEPSSSLNILEHLHPSNDQLHNVDSP
jgi:hypothetical protein